MTSHQTPSENLRILDFWGKARSVKEGGCETHSVSYHSLDVAAVASELLARDPARIGRIAAAVGLESSMLKGALPFFVSLHDIGKYSRVFQAKSPNHWPTKMLGPYRVAPGNSHVVTGFQMLVGFSENGPAKDIFETIMPGWLASERKILFRALAGHHEHPPKRGCACHSVRMMFVQCVLMQRRRILKQCTR
jgi:CRISPR-associated endonuclease/helicase Cas3